MLCGVLRHEIGKYGSFFVRNTFLVPESCFSIAKLSSVCLVCEKMNMSVRKGIGL